ncbi:hypothetical protein L1049_026661 [Liquidambar formosana]|uniref:MADS-box domain-containing protein n=1 Tax=Liquidambar formosana TaxID=63359 RepID=A0AAP0NFA4_LIQFO
MGRVKLQIKKIENTTNRQVTFSKRRNGLIKKAYELSVLCDVDVALIMFSPSGRVSLFSGNRSIEEILARYVNLPEHERGRLHNQEHLQRALGKLRVEANQCYQAASPINSDSQLEEIQQEILKYKSQLEDMKNRLRIFEGNPSEITTLLEAGYREQVLQETLKRVSMHKRVLEEKYSCGAPPTSQVHLPPETTVNANGFVTASPNNIMEWLPQRDPQVQIMNFLDSNGLLPLRDQPQRVVEILPQPSSLLQGQNLQLFDDHMSPGSGLEDDNNVQRPEFGQVIDVNLSPWAELYATGNGPFPAAQPRGRQLVELLLSQFTP